MQILRTILALTFNRAEIIRICLPYLALCVEDHLFMVFDCQTKIPNLAAAIAVQEDIFRLQVKVEDLVVMQEFKALHGKKLKNC